MTGIRPLLFGYETQVKPDGVQAAHVCPKCRQSSVFSSKSTKEIIVMFVPVSSSAEGLWVCVTENCGWMAPIEQEPKLWERIVEPKLVDV
ncbi:hypothetical protein B0H10DRAFT_2217868 [Mycena sp. CBHHK59/15]|nr:hypothetical protein B0H10DRAFT_2217868 [Mycena sp. CBHHK59/15]